MMECSVVDPTLRSSLPDSCPVSLQILTAM